MAHDCINTTENTVYNIQCIMYNEYTRLVKSPKKQLPENIAREKATARKYSARKSNCQKI